MAYEQQPNHHYTDPGTQVTSDHHQTGDPRSRPREQSISQNGFIMPEHNIHAPPQRVDRVDEAVTSAFDRAGAETSNYVPPELIAQITQNVIKQLQSTGIDGATPVPPQHSRFSPPPPPVHQPVPLSPSTASGTSPNMPNRVYTPPSPHKHMEYPSHPSPESHSRYVPEGSQSPRETKTAFSPPKRPSSPLSQSSDSSDKPQVRPKGPSRLSTSKEETTLEKIWGQLFDEESRPTVRLGQFLRGLAVHIIEDYEPRHSIVITPNKMIKYYEDVKLADEYYPWPVIFDDERSSISRMYRDLACQHHLVQERYHERPDIPGLTPVGFERWVTLLIQAHPEKEFERLQRAVLEMPISNPDDKKERFPKEISRRLFPVHGDHEVRDRIENAIEEHAAVDLPRRSSRDEPRSGRDSPQPHKPSVAEQAYVPQSVPQSVPQNHPQNHRPSVSFNLPHDTDATSDPPYVPSHLERERKPYSTIPDSAIDDTNHPGMAPPPPKPIERERAPYTAQPGGGKQYEDDLRAREGLSKPRAETIANPILPNVPKMGRSDSTASQARARPIPINNTRPMEIPKPEIHHHRAPSNAGGRRRRSPSFSRGSTNDFRRSEGDIRGYQPSSYQPPASMPVGAAPVETVFDENDTQRYFDKQARDRVARRKAEEDARNYGESPRRSYDRMPPPRRDDYGNEEDYYRAGGRGGNNGYGPGYDQPHGYR